MQWFQGRLVLSETLKYNPGSPDECVWKLIRFPDEHQSLSHRPSFNLKVCIESGSTYLLNNLASMKWPHSNGIAFFFSSHRSESLAFIVGIMQLQWDTLTAVSILLSLFCSNGVKRQADIPTFLNVRAVMSYFLFPEAWPAVRWLIKPNTASQSCSTNEYSRAHSSPQDGFF